MSETPNSDRPNSEIPNIEVWGRASSSNVQLVMWAIAEIGLGFTRHDAGFGFGMNDTPEFLAMNPNGLIPVIRDRTGGRDVLMWESAAIVRYLCASYAPEPLWPRDPAVRGPLDMWAEWAKTTFGPAFNSRIFWPAIRTPAAQIDRASLDRAIEAMKPVARMLDDRIGDGPWLAGQDFTFADILCGGMLYRYDSLDFDKAETPHLDAYYARLCQRPAYAEHVRVSYEALRAT